MIKTTDVIETLVRNWYAALDRHAPAETLVAMLDPADLKMVFPEATLTGLDGFTGWYEGVIRIFFDEVHDVKSVVVHDKSGGRYEVKVAVHWEASRWNSPSPTSDRIALIAYQTWIVTLTPQDLPRIAQYTVDRLEYLPGSATL